MEIGAAAAAEHEFSHLPLSAAKTVQLEVGYPSTKGLRFKTKREFSAWPGRCRGRHCRQWWFEIRRASAGRKGRRRCKRAITEDGAAYQDRCLAPFQASE